MNGAKLAYTEPSNCTECLLLRSRLANTLDPPELLQKVGGVCMESGVFEMQELPMSILPGAGHAAAEGVLDSIHFCQNA